jgi:mevalonate kinase|tara:strand:- start:17 stop:451 length:435 start_codon:yes stop_codon:yes gene_type:complete
MNNNFLPGPTKRKLTEQQRAFLDALSGQARGSIKQALVIAGYAETSQSAVVDSLKEEIIDVANTILAKSAPRAAEKLVEILESDDPIPQVSAKLQAAQTLLDRVGISKKEKLEVTHTAAGGIFLLPEKRAFIDVNAEEVDTNDA